MIGLIMFVTALAMLLLGFPVAFTLATWNVKQADRKSLAITLRHCLRFTTWASLKNENLSDKKIVELVMDWIAS